MSLKSTMLVTQEDTSVAKKNMKVKNWIIKENFP